jgi:uncharacterized protein with PIN domain
MFVDTSAFVAILTGEAEAETLARSLGRARHRTTSPLVRLEASAVLREGLARTAPLQGR